jgi:hypothetical protein
LPAHPISTTGLLSASCLIGALAVVMTGSSRAAVPEDTMRAWRDKAPEALDVTVLSSDQASTTNVRRDRTPPSTVTTAIVTLNARVDYVRRTASGVMKDSMIVVRYQVTREDPPVPGVTGNRALLTGEKATVYLKNMGANDFVPACEARLVPQPR